MKNYKVGDTIYIKDTVVCIDLEDTCITYRGHNGWIENDTVVDELPTAEPVKPVLSKAVADELETTKKLNVTFDGYIMRVIDNHYLYTNSHTFWMNSDDGVIKILMDAWYNGYTVEKPKLYNLILNDDCNGQIICLFNPNGFDKLYTDSYTSDIDLKHDERYQFTQEEIDKYNEDFWIKNLDLNDYKVEVSADEN